jgi:hypothetical protein
MSRHVDPAADVRAWLGPAWAALQARHGDIPGCAFVPAPQGVPDRGFGAVATPGYVWPDGGQITELTVIAFPGWLYCCVPKAFEILMHEAVHALDYARNREVSGHDEVFAALARELGLEPSPAERDGGAAYDVRLAEALRVRYADAISALSSAWRRLDVQQWVVG